MDDGSEIAIRGLPPFAGRRPIESDAPARGGRRAAPGPPRPGQGPAGTFSAAPSVPAVSPTASAEPSFHAVSRPASALTGDFYLRLRRGDGWLFGLGDVAGHGLEASVYMMMIQEEIERLATEELVLPALVAELHATMRRELPGSRFASMVLAELAPSGRMEIVNAGHCPPLLRRATGEVLSLPPNGPILGPLPRSRWSSLGTRLRSGDTLLLVSDGVLEARSPTGEEFGAERLWTSFERDGSLEVPALVLTLMDEVARFRAGSPPADDTTVVAIRG